MGPKVVAEVVRGLRGGEPFVESVHRGTVVGLARDGSLALRIGAPEHPVLPRSAVKPLQAAAMLRAGLDGVFLSRDIPPDLLAMVASSHSGEAAHVARVLEILSVAGVPVDTLRCPADLPLSSAAAQAHLRSGGRPEPVLMNCSGKHAGMIACCVAAGWSIEDYTEPDHPLQQIIRRTIEELTGEQIAGTAVDGCGAPLFALSLTGLARGVRAMVQGAAGSAERRVVEAMRGHPELIGGAGCSDTELMRVAPGVVAKNGAEGVTVVATPDGHAVAIKIADGGERAGVPVALAALSRLGAAVGMESPGRPELDLARLAVLVAPPSTAGATTIMIMAAGREYRRTTAPPRMNSVRAMPIRMK
ncbi:L-asparaginase [Frankia canadensis]|uniref:L-asparaginase n=1 Tax=Frankia canadensis TaxID=1836972 RepID=A0A2I2KMR0_9ACTN|nr:asparaginase [Frankia canadensis]SNQ46950.1 L-asparaginase [Frankia canadensis]SOU54240.1 L-asparaginase [Frankia canadensis]